MGNWRTGIGQELPGAGGRGGTSWDGWGEALGWDDLEEEGLGLRDA